MDDKEKERVSLKLRGYQQIRHNSKDKHNSLADEIEATLEPEVIKEVLNRSKRKGGGKAERLANTTFVPAVINYNPSNTNTRPIHDVVWNAFKLFVDKLPLGELAEFNLFDLDDTYDDATAIHLEDTRYFLRRYSFVEPNKISISRFEIKKKNVSKSRYQWLYTEYKEVERPNSRVVISGSGKIIKNHRNYLLLGHSTREQEGDSGPTTIRPQILDVSCILHDDNQNLVQGLKLDYLQQGELSGTPCAGAFWLQHIPEDTSEEEISNQIGLCDPTPLDLANINVEVNKYWSLFLPTTPKVENLIYLSESDRESLTQLQKATSADSFSEVMRKSLEIHEYVIHAKKSGSRIIIHDSDGEQKEII